jgi:hypothetical protein
VDVDGFPESFCIGAVHVHLVAGPVRTQRTEIQQRKPPPLVFDKHMDSAVLVGVGHMMTICELAGTLTEDIASQMDEWRQTCLEALGLVVAVLDDRLKGVQLFEDVLLFDGRGTHAATIDRVEYRRHYFPRRVESVDAANLEAIRRRGGASADPGVSTAVRYYLRGVDERPPDSIVHFWTALEALAEPTEKPVAGVERMLAEAGMSVPGANDVSVGRLYGLRGEIVHNATLVHPLLPDAHYSLEALLRGLIRHRLGLQLAETTWPIWVHQPLLVDDGSSVPGDWVAARTDWHESRLPSPR